MNDEERATKAPEPLISIPYYAPATDLPTRLPTISEIENAQEVLRERSIATVVAIGSHFVVKYGEGVDLDEGRMMIFMRQRTKVSVPRVFALYPNNGKSFIVMERINGTTLEETWHEFDDKQKMMIVAQLKKYITQIRTVESPGGYCHLDKKPLLNEIFRTPAHNCDGPFNTETELYDAIVRKCLASEALKHKAEYYREILPTVLRGHRPILTHGDIQRKNIMIRTGSVSDIVLLDWEIAGWYPSYWEYAATVFAGWFTDDWYRWIPDFLEPYPNEYAWYAMLAQEIGY
jgi:tRNA A-37 threonylcarbamoyl transferase component Bud32